MAGSEGDGKKNADPKAGVLGNMRFRCLAAGVVAEVAATIVAAIFESARVMATIAAMAAAVLGPDVVAVDPTASDAGSMAWDPNHFVVARPITRAVAVVRPVANRDADSLGFNDSRRD